MAARPYIVVAAIDRSDFAELVLEHALALAAQRQDAVTHVLGVLEGKRPAHAVGRRRGEDIADLELELRRRVEGALENLGSIRGARIRVHARLGTPHEEILDLADELRADLMILGRHGAGGSARTRTGSVPAQVLSDARCPVWVLSPTDYGDPAQEEAGCPECIAVRRESSGDRWFCGAHATGYRWRSSFMNAGDTLVRDQGIWF